MKCWPKFGKLVLLATGVMLLPTVSTSLAQEEGAEKKVHEPVFRVSRKFEQPTQSNNLSLASDNKAENDNSAKDNTAKDNTDTTQSAPERVAANLNKNTEPRHPLDPAIDLAHVALENIQTNIDDYTAILVKRERLKKELGSPEFFKVKIRNRKVEKDIPLSVYMRFLKPKSKRGMEVIWIEGENNGKLLAHEVPGFKNIFTAKLDPNGFLAMRGQRYPITEAGIENLVVKLLEKATRDKAAGKCTVEFFDNAQVFKRPCTKIKVTHDVEQDPYDFHMAEVFIDKEMNIPVRYVAYDWPTRRDASPPIIEEYTYVNVELNVGLTDKDFDPTNTDYDFP